MTHTESVLVLDFGGQYTQLIARRVRELGVFSEIRPFNEPIDKIKAFHPSAVILSGGPSSVYDAQAPKPDSGVFELGVPVLGICPQCRPSGLRTTPTTGRSQKSNKILTSFSGNCNLSMLSYIKA